MHSTGQPVSQSGVGYVVVLQLFSLASSFLHTECRNSSVHHGLRPFWVLNSVLVQNLLRFCQKKDKETHTKNVIKMCSFLRSKATKNQY